MKLSNEGLFIIKNWRTIKQLIQSEQDFRQELSKFLYSIEKRFVNKKWWDGLNNVFIKHDEDQVYISRKNWRINKDDYYIWIGVEGFTPENLFGIGTQANCYLWVDSGPKTKKIATDLRNVIKKRKEFEDYVNDRGSDKNGKYILKKEIKQYTGNEYKEFIKGAPLNEIIDFIEKVYKAIKDYKV